MGAITVTLLTGVDTSTEGLGSLPKGTHLASGTAGAFGFQSGFLQSIPAHLGIVPYENECICLCLALG